MSRAACLRFVFVLLFGITVWFDFGWIHPANRTYAKEYLNESLALSMGTYATCRIINGGVSSIQESSISISPWGIGLQYEAGQILDPINDATERLSEACVRAMALLGVQRLLLSGVNAYTIVPFYVILALFLVGMSLPRATGMTVFLGRLAVLLLLVRLSTPLMCYVGTEMNENYFIPEISAEQATLAEVKKIALAEFETEIPILTSESTPASGSLDTIVQFFSDFGKRIAAISASVSHRTSSLAKAVLYLKDNFDTISESLAGLFVLVIEKVILQVFVIPLATFFLLKQLFAFLSAERFGKWVERIRDFQQSKTGIEPSGSTNV